MSEQLNYQVRLFAEGVRIPVFGVSRTQTNSGRFSMTLQIPPTPEALMVPPNTYFHAFVRSIGGHQPGKFVLFGEGRMKTRGLGTDTDGGRYVVVQCEGVEGDWSQFKLGFNIGQDANLNLPRLMRFFVGLSSGEGELFDGYDAAMAAQSLATITGADRAPYLDFYFVLARLVEQMGPISTIAHIATNLAAFSPLYKQLYESTKVAKKIGFAENRRVGEYLGANVLLESFLGRVQSMPNDASLFDLMQMLLPDTLHHYTHIASPWFNEAALNNVLKLVRTTKGELHPSLLPSLIVPSGAPSGVAVGSGGWVSPMTVAMGTRSGQRYGAPRDRNGVPGEHHGVDYPAPVGTPVFAPRGGRAFRSYDSPALGKVIQIDHGDGYQSRYLHLSVRSVSAPTTVVAGQQIGLSGNTGTTSRGPHLHFEIKLNGKYIDPTSVLGAGASTLSEPPAPVAGTRLPPPPNRTGTGSAALDAMSTLHAQQNGQVTQGTFAAPRGSTPSGSTTRATSAPGAYRPGTTAQSTAHELVQDPRVLAFLDLLAKYEAGTDQPMERQYRQFNSAVFGVRGTHFTDLSQHPWEGVTPRAPGNASDSGRYQFVLSTWRGVARTLRLTDFSAASQDLGAVQKAKERGAMPAILAGNISEMRRLLTDEWVFFPKKTVAELTTAYNAALTARSNGTAPLASGGTGDAGAPGGGGPLVQMYPLDYQYENMFGPLPQSIIKPQLDFAPPPLCNVVFPHQITNLQFIEDQRSAPTRLLVYGNPVVLRTQTVAAAERSAGLPLHFAPRYLRFLFDSLRGGNKKGDILSAEADGTANKAVAAYTARIEQSSGADAVRFRDDAVERELAAISSYKAAAASEAGNDAVQGVMDGSGTPEGNPDGLLGLYTYDELFRGVLPAVAQFPFLDDDAVSQRVEEETITQIIANAELALSAVPADNPDLKKQREWALYNAKRLTHEGESTIAATNYLESLDETEKKERLSQFNSVDLYASHQFAQMRRQGGTANLTGPLNMHVVAGFSGAFYEASVGWIVGTVEAISDTVSVQGNASTTLQFSQCIPYADYNDPVYKQFRIESESESGQLRSAGLPENPAFLDNKYSSSRVGQTVYKPILGQGSVVDWYRNQLTRTKAALAGRGVTEQDLEEGRAGDLEVPSISVSLEKLLESYNQAAEKGVFAATTTARTIATEGQVMQTILKGRPMLNAALVDNPSVDGLYNEYWAGYKVTEMPDANQSFMNERRDWALRYYRDYEARAGTFSARAPFGGSTEALDN